MVANEYGAIHVPQAFVLNVSKGTPGVKIVDNLQGSKSSKEKGSIRGLPEVTVSS
jgi:hypothetical protein